MSKDNPMNYLGFAKYKSEVDLLAITTPEQKAQEEAFLKRLRAVEQRWANPPDVVDQQWLKDTMDEQLLVGLYDDEAHCLWTVVRWIAEGRIQDVQGCCEAILRPSGGS